MSTQQPETCINVAPKKRIRGFAALDPDRKREIASLGGRAAHDSGRAHEFTSEEASRTAKLSHASRAARKAADAAKADARKAGKKKA